MDCSNQISLSVINSPSLLKLTSIESVMASNHLIICPPFLLPPSIFPSIRVFSNESVLCIKCWSLQSIGASALAADLSMNSELSSFRMDWLNLLSIQGTLKSLLQHCSLKQSILQCLSFFMVQLSQWCTTTRKTIGLSIQTFVDKVVSLMLSRFVIAFLPRSKHLLIHGVHCGSTIMKSWRIKNLMEDAGLKIQ